MKNSKSLREQSDAEILRLHRKGFHDGLSRSTTVKSVCPLCRFIEIPVPSAWYATGGVSIGGRRARDFRIERNTRAPKIGFAVAVEWKDAKPEVGIVVRHGVNPAHKTVEVCFPFRRGMRTTDTVNLSQIAAASEWMLDPFLAFE